MPVCGDAPAVVPGGGAARQSIFESAGYERGYGDDRLAEVEALRYLHLSTPWPRPAGSGTAIRRVLILGDFRAGTADANVLQWGIESRHGAENAALKNIAPFNRTPLRTSENASIFLRTPGKLS